MASPFPGMDPYLEGYLWPDVHHRLATAISDQLTPRLRPRYVARIEVQVVPDESPEEEVGIMYPDVEIMQRPLQPGRFAPLPQPSGVLVAEAPAYTPSSLIIPVLRPEVRVATVEIRDTAQNQLVTAIEILSPVNKREPGLARYREKWNRLHAAGVHIVEIDLLRRGQRPLSHPRLNPSAYRVILLRAMREAAEVWALRLQDPLPVVPVPLRAPDDDVPLDLPTAFTNIYERAAYELSVNYRETPPPPALTPEEQVWVEQHLGLQ